MDKAAAGRFIKHAISEARQSISTSAAEPTSSEAGPPRPQRSTSMPVRVTEKMKEREEYLRRVAEEPDSEGAVLDVIDDATGETSTEVEKDATNLRDEQGTTTTQEVTTTESLKKKRRRPMDPFDRVLAFTRYCLLSPDTINSSCWSGRDSCPNPRDERQTKEE